MNSIITKRTCLSRTRTSKIIVSITTTAHQTHTRRTLKTDTSDPKTTMSKNWNPHEGQDQQQQSEPSKSSSSNTHAIQGRFQTLRSTFEHHPFSEHQAQWDALWKNSITPWDRGGPSMALHDLLIEHPDLFPHEGRTAKPKALVPGCGRGHDALLLAYVFGYDVCALDSSATSLEAAAENERRVMANEEGVVYALRDGVPDRGKVQWVQGDFFSDEWRQDFDNNNTRPGTWAGYDLIFDYAVSSARSQRSFQTFSLPFVLYPLILYTIHPLHMRHV